MLILIHLLLHLSEHLQFLSQFFFFFYSFFLVFPRLKLVQVCFFSLKIIQVFFYLRFDYIFLIPLVLFIVLFWKLCKFSFVLCLLSCSFFSNPLWFFYLPNNIKLTFPFFLQFPLFLFIYVCYELLLIVLILSNIFFSFNHFLFFGSFVCLKCESVLSYFLWCFLYSELFHLLDIHFSQLGSFDRNFVLFLFFLLYYLPCFIEPLIGFICLL